jgi:hypothetical protein
MNRNQFVSTLAALRPSSTYLSLHGYKNEADEVADFNLLFHISYKTALERSIDILSAIKPETSIDIVAKEELIASFNLSLEKMAATPLETLQDGYTRFYDEDGAHIKGIKLHDETNTLHLYGLVANKVIRTPGTYKHVNHRKLTLAKDKLRRLTPAGKFRQFKIRPEQLDYIKVEKMKLLPPNVRKQL